MTDNCVWNLIEIDCEMQQSPNSGELIRSTNFGTAAAGEGIIKLCIAKQILDRKKNIFGKC